MHDEDQPKAHVDENGNIHVPNRQESRSVRNAGWEVTEGDTVIRDSRRVMRTKRNAEDVVSLLKSVRGNLIGTTLSLAREGKNQYMQSLKDFWEVLRQPVWVPRKNKPPKEYSRGTLFVADVFRFGGTFAVIFLGLFVTLNFQSFSKIVTPYLDPVERISQADSGGNINIILPSIAKNDRAEGNLLDYLGEVGPPENWVMIPSLNIKVPLMEPSYSSLLREDWVGVEEDIQLALEHGVVHYPGTARPGQAGNFFITGHSSYYPWAKGDHKYVFARLHELVVGDEYWVYYGGDKHRYIVTGKKEVKPSDVTVLDQPINKRMGTLMTCTPVGTTLRRLILTSQEVDPLSGVALEVGQRETRVASAPLPSALPI